MNCNGNFAALKKPRRPEHARSLDHNKHAPVIPPRNAPNESHLAPEIDTRPTAFFASDHVNIMCSARKDHGSGIRYMALLEDLNRRYAWIRKPLICAVRRPDQDLGNFENHLKRLGAEVEIKKIVYNDGKGMADFDMLIGINCAVMAPICDWIVLATGDGHFVDLVHWLHEQNVKVELVAFKNDCSRALKAVVDKFTELSGKFLFNQHQNEHKTHRKRRRRRRIQRLDQANRPAPNTVSRLLPESSQGRKPAPRDQVGATSQ